MEPARRQHRGVRADLVAGVAARGDDAVEVAVHRRRYPAGSPLGLAPAARRPSSTCGAGHAPLARRDHGRHPGRGRQRRHRRDPRPHPTSAARGCAGAGALGQAPVRLGPEGSRPGSSTDACPAHVPGPAEPSRDPVPTGASASAAPTAAASAAGAWTSRRALRPPTGPIPASPGPDARTAAPGWAPAASQAMDRAPGTSAPVPGRSSGAPDRPGDVPGRPAGAPVGPEQRRRSSASAPGGRQCSGRPAGAPGAPRRRAGWSVERCGWVRQSCGSSGGCARCAERRTRSSVERCGCAERRLRRTGQARGPDAGGTARPTVLGPWHGGTAADCVVRGRTGARHGT